MLTHITIRDYEIIYEPAEDSFLMLDALEKEHEFLSSLKPTLCMEVGAGSGINITAFAKVFRSCYCFCCDINFRACEISSETAKINHVAVDCLRMDLTRGLRDKLIDVIIFNPPYVVTDPLERTTSDIAKAWAGGINGREVIDRFLNLIPDSLSDNGVCYMLVVEENLPREIKKLALTLGFETTIVIKRKAWNEKLQVLKFSRIKN